MINNGESGAVLVGVDDSPQAGLAADWAATEAEWRGCDLRLVHAVDTGAAAPLRDAPSDITKQILDQARTMLDDAVARIGAEHPGLRVSASLVRGEPAEAIVAAAGDAALVVVGTRGRGGFTGLLLGSVSLEVAARSPRPVVVVRGRADGTVEGARGDIVVGVRAERDADAVQFALAEAQRRKAPVRLVHAWSPLAAVGLMAPQVDHLGEDEHAHEKLMNRAARPAADYPDVHLDTELMIGSPAAALVDASAEAALLVIPRHPPAARLGVHLGPVVHAVLHHAQCPVAVVPTG